MSTRKDIINQLKTDMVNAFDATNVSYMNVTEVVCGIVNFDYFATRPAVAYWAFSDEKNDEYLDDERHRILNIIIYGYTDLNNVDQNYDDIYDLADDVERFLMSSDWTYTDCTLLGDIIVTVGGTDNQRCMFDLTIQVEYVQEF